jgi:hypothetical protein
MIGLSRRGKKSHNGYALLLMTFFLALLVVSLTVARPSLILRDRREKETEMIWRGKQYARAIRMYYQKTHRFPAELEDLYKPKTGIRFMRKAYKDPMNTADGSWRLIYVGPAGQLVGSLTQPASLFPTNASTSNLAASFNDPLSGRTFSSKDPLGSFGNARDNFSSNSFSSNASGDSANSQAIANNPANSTSSPSTSDPANSAGLSASGFQPLATDSSPPVTSNPIIGVGSKIDKRSIIWMDGAKDYLHFEFIYRAVTVDPRTVTPDP